MSAPAKHQILVVDDERFFAFSGFPRSIPAQLSGKPTLIPGFRCAWQPSSSFFLVLTRLRKSRTVRFVGLQSCIAGRAVLLLGQTRVALILPMKLILLLVTGCHQTCSIYTRMNIYRLGGAEGRAQVR